MSCTVQSSTIQCPAVAALTRLVIIVIFGRTCKCFVEKVSRLSGLAKGRMPFHQAAFQIHAVGDAWLAGVNALCAVVLLERGSWFRKIDLELGSNFEDLGKMI
jgi:hypothetical protein